ncbi:hypothetical protein ES703_07935 [subsurface metagenome]
MRTFIKVFGPPVLKAIRALELIAGSMPEVQIKDTIIVQGLPPTMSRDVGVSQTQRAGRGSLGLYPGGGVRRLPTSHDIAIPVERTRSIVSNAGESIGDYDFFFKWVQEPTQEQLFDLIDRIDVALAPMGCWYRITNTNA